MNIPDVLFHATSCKKMECIEFIGLLPFMDKVTMWIAEGGSEHIKSGDFPMISGVFVSPEAEPIFGEIAAEEDGSEKVMVIGINTRCVKNHGLEIQRYPDEHGRAFVILGRVPVKCFDSVKTVNIKKEN